MWRVGVYEEAGMSCGGVFLGERGGSARKRCEWIGEVGC